MREKKTWMLVNVVSWKYIIKWSLWRDLLSEIFNEQLNIAQTIKSNQERNNS